MFDVDKARDLFEESSKAAVLCECCGHPLVQPGTGIELCCKLKKLAQLGSGYKLYYLLKKHMILYLLIISIVVSLPCTIIAAIQLNDDEYLKNLKDKSLNSYIA